ncbi:glycosyltransferase [Dysgonomonas macrotermitis]|uniref:Glycosyltransferase involved in cell wall bisynthesis n=1 Tax=Dysgonomonas macrotermitis TaxID=1346286 RepID=A0A1M5DTJ8_9BACT|nr:glycosyltransferase [Dysgonomonas macrotermitis]SHF70122.1 Glycosyltransferase involved in cell wall bisynthesis [Dysgonomonas macrotermitis]
MKLSIITINYNNSEGLEKTIQSIVNQDFFDYEYIVIDGGSTDGSVDVIKKYSRIDYWLSEPDSGVYNAMNKGIKKAQGEYLLFINSGDMLYNNQVLSNVFAKNIDNDLLYGDLHRIFPDGHSDIVQMPDFVGCDQMMESTLTHPTTFIKRSLFDKYGLYREDLKIVSDWAFFFKIIVFSNVSRSHLPITIATFDMEGMSTTNTNLVQAERQKVIGESFSYELYNIYYTHGAYKQFYNHKIFRIARSIKHSLKNALSKKYWFDLIHKKRFHFAITRINKTVRNQKKNPLSIPVIIINYNRLRDLKELVTFLLERKHQNIVIVDNKSTYPPLLEYYKEIEGKVNVEFMDQNYGHLVFWKNKSLYNKYGSGYYIITDSDVIPNKDLPEDYITYLIKILDKYPQVSKVGFALDVDDIPEHYQLKEQVLNWESPHWEGNIGKNLYLNELDTTFAIYPPYYNYSTLAEFYPAIRISGNFTAKHMGWYIDNNNLDAEDLYYYNHANSSSSWKLNEKGEFVGNQIYNKE